MELSPDQILLIGIVASVLSAVLRLLVAKFGSTEISKFWMTIIVSVVSLILAVLFAGFPELPAYVDPFQYAMAWLAILSGYVGAATLIYNLLLDKVLDKVGLQVERLAAG
jgi:nitrate/nitrite transporter NarK